MEKEIKKMIEDISDRSAEKAHEKATRHKDIVIEEMRSDFRIFGEMLDHVKKKGDATFDELGKVKQDVTTLKQDVSEIKDEMKIMNGRIENIEEEVRALRKDFDLMKEEMVKGLKIETSRAENIEERLILIEKHLNLAT